METMKGLNLLFKDGDTGSLCDLTGSANNFLQDVAYFHVLL